MIRLALRVGRADAELVLADLIELAPAGVEEVELPARDGREAQVEYAIYGPPGELPRLPQLQALAGGVRVELSSSEVPDDWPERWKRFHTPVLIEAPAPPAGRGGGPSTTDKDTRLRVSSLHIRPPWEPQSARADAIEIVIDPAQAFGTGAHATTRLCLELLLALAAADPARGAALDVGTGSGVLAIAAAKLGYGPVLALDNDPLSVQAASANANVAGVAVEVRRHDLRAQLLPRGHPVVLANLLRPLLIELAGSLERAGARAAGGWGDGWVSNDLIVSGLLREEADEVAAVYADSLNLRERERRERGDWSALWLARA